MAKSLVLSGVTLGLSIAMAITIGSDRLWFIFAVWVVVFLAFWVVHSSEVRNL